MPQNLKLVKRIRAQQLVLHPKFRVDTAVRAAAIMSALCRPGSVEAGSIRFGPLAYVAAFSGGGVKDITSR